MNEKFETKKLEYLKDQCRLTAATNAYLLFLCILFSLSCLYFILNTSVLTSETQKSNELMEENNKIHAAYYEMITRRNLEEMQEENKKRRMK